MPHVKTPDYGLKMILVSFIPILLMGCTTAITLSEPTTKNKVYSGTGRQIYLGCAHGTCLDFPFSLLADTVLLPITIPWTLVNFTDGKSEASKTTTSQPAPTSSKQ